MGKSETAADLDIIQRVVGAYLKTLGFRMRGRTFNRLREDRIVQVVNFWMGPYPIGKYVVPGLRENLYGTFSVNLGITLPCVRRDADSRPEKEFYQEYECHVRLRLPTAGGKSPEGWWPIEPPYQRLGSEIAMLLEKVGMPFIDQFTSYEKVVEYYRKNQELPSKTGARSALEVALIHRERSRHERHASRQVPSWLIFDVSQNRNAERNPES